MKYMATVHKHDLQNVDHTSPVQMIEYFSNFVQMHIITKILHNALYMPI